MLDQPIQSYSDNLSALREFVDLIGPFLKEQELSKVRENAADLAPIIAAISKLDPGFALAQEIAPLPEDAQIEIEVTENPDGNPNAMIRLPRSRAIAFGSALRSWTRAMHQTELLYRTSLISLVSTAEYFLSDVLHFYYEQFQDAVGTKDVVFSLDDLKTFGSIDDARRSIIDSRVESVLRGSLPDWIEFFRTKPKLSLSYLDDRLDRMAEVYQRRNLFVHNGGIVNTIYLARVPATLRPNAKLGDVVRVDPKYLEASLDEFEHAFILLAAELWKKINPEDKTRSALLNRLAFEHLRWGRWAIGDALSQFVIMDKKVPEADRMVAQLNHWQALKWSGRFEEVREAVENADYSAKDILYQLARHALLDNTEHFFEILPRAIASEALGPAELEEWPIFQAIRGTAGYAAFKQSTRDSPP